MRKGEERSMKRLTRRRGSGTNYIGSGETHDVSTDATDSHSPPHLLSGEGMLLNAFHQQMSLSATVPPKPSARAATPRRSPSVTVASRKSVITNCSVETQLRSNVNKASTTTTPMEYTSIDDDISDLDYGFHSDGESSELSKVIDTDIERRNENNNCMTEDASKPKKNKKESKRRGKLKSIFRRKLRYTKRTNDNGCNNTKEVAPAVKEAPTALTITATRKSQASHCESSPKTPNTDASTVESSPKTPNTHGGSTVASLDYSAESETSPTSDQVSAMLISAVTRNDSIELSPVSPSSSAADTYSTLTSQSWTVNLTPKSAPPDISTDLNIAKLTPKSSEDEISSSSMDYIFFTAMQLSQPSTQVEDMLRKSRSKRSRHMRTKSLPASTSTGGNDEQATKHDQTWIDRSCASITNLSLVKKDEAANQQARPEDIILNPRFRSQDGKEVPIHRHQRTPSRNEMVLSASSNKPQLPKLPSRQPSAASSSTFIPPSSSNHVQFRDSRLCSFYSGGNNLMRQGSSVYSSDVDLPYDEVLSYRQQEENLDDEIYATLASLQAFDCKVETIEDGMEEPRMSFVSSLSSSSSNDAMP